MKYLTFNLLHWCEFAFPKVIERLSGGGLKISSILSHATGCCVTAFTHARMITQSTFVQIRMCESIYHWYSLILRTQKDGEEEKKEKIKTKDKKITWKSINQVRTKAFGLFFFLTGSKTSIWQSRWTASCVACELNVYNADKEGGFGTLRSMWVRAPSHACFISSIDGVPNNSVINSSYMGVKERNTISIKDN